MHFTLIKLTKNYAKYQDFNLAQKESLQWVLVRGI
jgi:hypothetical protein